MNTTTMNLISHQPNGIKTIEASAGTGKTFTLMILVYKALFQLSDGGKKKQFSIKHILAVTFTEAATKELKKRIWDTLDKAYQYHSLGIHPDDDTLKAIFDQLITSESQRLVWVNYLSEQLQLMDEASIFTIHGFCNKIVQEHPFECGIPGNFELIQSLYESLEKVILTQWRSLIRKPETAHHLIERWLKNPEYIIETFGKNLISPIIIEHDPDVKTIAENLEDEFNQLRTKLFNEWSWASIEQEVQAFYKQIDSFNNRSFKSDDIEDALHHLKLWLKLDFVHLETTTIEKRDFFKLSKYFDRNKFALKKNKELQWSIEQSDLFDYFSELFALQLKLSDLEKQFIATYLAQIQIKFQYEKKVNAWFSFDDLLRLTDSALKQNSVLRTEIKRSYPYVFIDEFQDTDPVQFSIFEQICIQSNSTDPKVDAFYMIGDPKQSIYGFRNADLNTYIYARNHSNEIATLSTNYRSSEKTIKTVNSFFSLAENIFSNEEIRFSSVESFKKTKIEYPEKTLEKAMLVIHEKGDEKPTANASENRAIRMSIDYIQYLLNNDCHFINKDSNRQRIVKGDIAILVKTNNQADQFYRALRREKIPAVIHSRKSVFETKDALQLMTLLKSITKSRSLPWVRLGLMTQFFPFKSSEIKLWDDDDVQLIEAQEYFIKANQIWNRNDLGSALGYLSSKFSFISNMLTYADAERSIANYKHLLELLNKAEKEIKKGSDGIIDYLDEKIVQVKKEFSSSDEELLLLESDQRKVKIVTIHSSKGLEYPIVIHPFLWKRKSISKFISNHIQSISVQNNELEAPQIKKVFIDSSPLLNGKTIKQYHIEQIHQEESRNMYVALTRAEYQNVIILPNYNDKNNSGENTSPLSMLEIWAEKAIGVDQQTEFFNPILQQFQQVEECGLIDYENSIEILKMRSSIMTDSKTVNETFQTNPIVRTEIHPAWKKTSYSGISHQSKIEMNSTIESKESEPIDESELVYPKKENGVGVHALKSGKQLGNVMHFVFEIIESSDLNSVFELVKKGVSRFGYEHYFSIKEQKEIAVFISSIYQTSFHLLDEKQTIITLESIPKTHQKRESEFLSQIASFDLKQFFSLLRDSSEMESNQVEDGFITGFIDLLFIVDGKFYMLDYKSNKLGYDSSFYSETYLRKAMIDNKYDVQLIIYSLALHRWLKLIFPEYRYETHFGGMFYWFVRGYENPTKGLFFEKLDVSKLEQMEQLIMKESV